MFSFDLRGHGRSEGRRGHVDAFPRFLEDLLAMEREMEGLVGRALPKALMGHSLGGLIGIRRLQTFSGPFIGGVFSAPWLEAAQPDWVRKLGRGLGWALPEFPFPSGIGAGGLTRDPEMQKSIKADPLVHRRITGRLFREAVDDDDIATIRDHVNQGRALGSEALINRIEATLNRRVRLVRCRRPGNKVL